MDYFSICDGIGAAHAALLPLGYTCAGVSEVDKFCNKLIESKYNVKNFGDFTKWKTWEKIKVDVVVGGSPCQSFSTLGQRRGLQAPTGRLSLDFVNFICKNRPSYFLWENVAAVLFAERGRMFQWMLSRFVQCGYGLAWRILNSRFFGVPQYRRRIFLVGCFGDPIRAGKILFETEKMSVNHTASKTERQADSRTVAFGHHTDSMQNRMDKHSARYRQNDPVVGTLTTQIDSGAEQVTRLIIDGNRVRYLMPIECERLQGFPDGYTAGFSDSTRYKMIGNSMPVPVIKWIGARILQQEQEAMILSKAG